MDHPFLRLYSVNRSDMATDVAHSLILAGGTAALSVRAVAGGMDMTPPGLLHIFGSREGMLTSIAQCYAGRWDGWLAPRLSWTGVTGALPDDDDERDGAAVWLAVTALARSVPAVAQVVAWAHERERAHLRTALVDGPYRERLDADRDGRPQPPRNPTPDDVVLDLLHATIRGLRHRITDPTEPLSLTSAATALERLRDSLVPAQDPPAA